MTVTLSPSIDADLTARSAMQHSRREIRPMKAIAKPKFERDENSASFALIKFDEFELARAVIPEFSSYRDYEDWLDFREGSALALSMAGVNTRLVQIELAAFLKWCRRTSTRPNLRALDAYSETIAEEIHG